MSGSGRTAVLKLISGEQLKRGAHMDRYDKEGKEGKRRGRGLSTLLEM